MKKQAIRSKSEILMQAYRNIRNQANKLNVELKRKCFTNKISSCEGDLKSTWKLINSVLTKKSKTINMLSINIDRKYISTRLGIAESMKNFLCTMGEALSDKNPRAKSLFLRIITRITHRKLGLNSKVVDIF